MGKFFDALQKTDKAKQRGLPESVSRENAKIPHEEVDNLSLGERAIEGPNVEPKLINGRIDPRLVSLLEPNTPEAECFKILRVKLLFGGNGRCCRTIMVSSPQPFDGKTLVAANLAVSIAQGFDEHVLLVDCDFRRPLLHQTFGMKAHRGLREYLENGTSLSPFMLSTPVEKLTLLPAGYPPNNPSELLSSEKMRRLIDELKARYQDRYIIFDTPPAQFTPEGSLLASMVDGVLLVVRSGKTPREQVLDVINNIGRDKILGLVFNAHNDSPNDPRQYYRYYKNGKGNQSNSRLDTWSPGLLE
jgi:exopolysaccharide/PEP-CTERM locus tyrosine autokinase